VLAARGFIPKRALRLHAEGGRGQIPKMFGDLIVPTSAPIAPTPIAPADILTVNELAARLKVQPTWVYENQRRDNPMPALHCGRYLRFSWPVVCEWLAAQPAVKRTRKPLRRAAHRKETHRG
jgi:hypothetical protein